MLACLVGIDGCGKSTQAERLVAARVADEARPLRLTGVWDLLVDPELNAGAFMGRPAEFRAYLGRLTSTSRCLFVFHALHESFRRAQAAAEAEGADLLAVGYRYKYSLVEGLLGTPPALLAGLEELFPEPDRVLWLDLDPAEAAARRQGFSRYECGGGDPGPEAFAAFQGRCRRRLAERAEAEGWVRVDGSGAPEAVTARLQEAMRP